MIVDNLFLFSLGAHSLILIMTLVVWFKAYKKIAPELKKSFLVQTSLAFAYLVVLNYATQIPFLAINVHLEGLYNFLFFCYIAISSSALTFLLFLWARSLHLQLSLHKQTRVWVEYGIVFALNAAFQLYLWNTNLQYWGEWYSGYCQAQLAAFSTTVLYAIIRNKISLYLEKKNR